MSPSVAFAFLRRDFKIAISYRTGFALQILGIFLAVPIFFFMGNMVDESTSAEALKSFGGSYFGFLLIGIALLDYLAVSIKSFGESLRESQLTGTLEIVLLSPTSLIEVLLYSSMWFYLFTTLRFVLYLVVGAMFELDLAQINIVGAIVVLMVGVASFVPFGILTASFIMVVKRGQALGGLISGASLFFGGVLFPIASMPELMQLISKTLPFTYALAGMRKAIQQGALTAALWPEISVLALFAAVLLPLSFWVFVVAVRRTRITGTLSHY